MTNYIKQEKNSFTYFMKYQFIYRIAFCLQFLIICGLLRAQFFSSGNESFHVKWQSIETERFELIFPSGLNHLASRFASCIDNNFVRLQYSMNTPVKRIPIIFHNQNVLSNGFVTWAPKRMEIYSTPSRDLQPLDWIENLALHEYRHVLQVYKLNKGFTRILSFFTGQTAIGLPVSQIPLWLNEGDAVIAETVFSESGRGRLPAFEMPFKACILNHKTDFSYDKFYFGSYKDFVPDYYKLGFYLTTHARLKYDKYVWDKIFDHAGKLSFVPYSLNHGLKKYYHTSRKTIFAETIDSLKSLWSNQYSNFTFTDYSNIPIKETDKYTSYRYIHLIKDSFLVAFKSSIDEMNCIVQIDNNGNEKVLHTPGYVFENRLSCGTGLIVWDEIVADVRWEQVNYSVIKSYDLTAGKVKSLTAKSRFFSPCIAKNDKKIALVQIDTENNCWLVIIDANTGHELNRCPSPEPGLINFPIWNGSGSIITVFTTLNNGMLIYSLNLNTCIWEPLTTPTFENISQISLWKGFVIFSAGFSGIDNIYALNIDSKELFQITSSRHGAFDPFVDDKSSVIYYSQYTVNGYHPVSTNLDETNWISFDSIEHIKSGRVEILAEQEKTDILNENCHNTAYEIKPYSRFNNLINIHSWLPFYFGPQFKGLSDFEITPGVMILSQNDLSTSISTIGISYENKSFIFRPSIHYSGFFPVFDFTATMGGDNKRHVMPTGIVPKDTTFPFFRYTFDCYVPYRILNNKYRKLFYPEVGIEYENTLYYNNHIKKGILFIHYKFLYFRYLILSQRDIYPKWGQLINLTFTHTPFESSQYGILSSTSGQFYFPGLLKHQSIMLFCGLQYREIERRKYFYPVNRVSLPRGYSFEVKEPLARMILKCSLIYGMPLMYPDLSFGSLAYIKRIRANVFYDYSYGYDILNYIENHLVKTSENYYSFGIDLLTDLHLFRFYFPFSLGMRISYIPEFGKVYPEILFSVDTSVF